MKVHGTHLEDPPQFCCKVIGWSRLVEAWALRFAPYDYDILVIK